MRIFNRNINQSAVAYWILGLCNNYGYVVMLSAAHDILAQENIASHITQQTPSEERKCNELSTGIILLADIIPALVVKIILPFLPLWMNLRLFLTIVTAAMGFILVATANSLTQAILGVACTSFSSGLGESSLLSFTVFYKDKSIIGAWSSGTGGAGFFGSLTYAALVAIGLSPSTTLFLLLSVPAAMAVSFWIILESPSVIKPTETSEINSSASEIPSSISHQTFLSRIGKIPMAMKYFLPLSFVYYFEYLINQGLFELSLVEDSFIDGKTQYRWYQVCYQIGVFISRSSISILQIEKLWILALLQGVNLVYFAFEAIFSFTHSVLIIFAIILWEGLLGGLTYVNAFYNIQVKENPADREVITGITTVADSIGIGLSGLTAIPVHNKICNLPKFG